VDGLKTQPQKVIVDGNQIPKGIIIPCEAIVGGDASHAEISAASILAKVTRDRQMTELDQHIHYLVLPNIRVIQLKRILKRLQLTG